MSKKNTREVGDKLEDRVLADLEPLIPGGARMTSNSGARNSDGDLETAYYQICCKRKLTLENPSVSKKEWADIKRAADRRGREPVCIRENRKGELFAIVHYEEFIRLIDAAFQKLRRQAQYEYLIGEESRGEAGRDTQIIPGEGDPDTDCGPDT